MCADSDRRDNSIVGLLHFVWTLKPVTFRTPSPLPATGKRLFVGISAHDSGRLLPAYTEHELRERPALPRRRVALAQVVR